MLRTLPLLAAFAAVTALSAQSPLTTTFAGGNGFAPTPWSGSTWRSTSRI